MKTRGGALFDLGIWKPALEKFGAVTHLSVILYDADAAVVCGPVPPTPLHALLGQHHDPGLFAECARACLDQSFDRPAEVVSSFNLAVVGTSLFLEGKVAGAAVAGYALADFSQSEAIAQLARRAGIPFPRLWSVARQQQPVPRRRLILHGELLQLLGDTILKENLRTRQYEAAAAQLRLEVGAKDEFLAILSHELRTPLTPILVWAEILKEAGDDPVHQARAAASIERNVLQQIRLVDDLLDLNRVIKDKVTLDVQFQDLSAVLREALDTAMGPAAKKKVEVTSIEPGEPLFVDGDASRLQQIFGNVLTNAIKFTPAGGTVTVTTEPDGDCAVVRIADSGEGIDPAFLPHVFELFRQQEQGTLRRHSGLGIGLALVKRLVELHGGQVGISSDGPQCGTEVRIRLPLSRGAAGHAPLTSQMEPLSLKGLSILVIEDTEDALEATRVMLEVLGARVFTGRDGFEALAALAAERPDLILCDLRMPRMDGFQFMKELRHLYGRNHPPVVAVTGFARQIDHERTRAAGFQGHLNKPYDSATLLTVIADVLRREALKAASASGPSAGGHARTVWH